MTASTPAAESAQQQQFQPAAEPLSALQQAALAYHRPIDGNDTAGKVAIQITKRVGGQDDLSLAYSPGVAAPCEEIARDPALATMSCGTPAWSPRWCSVTCRCSVRTWVPVSFRSLQNRCRKRSACPAA